MAGQVSIILKQSPAELSALLEDHALAVGNALLADLSSENVLQGVEMLRSIRLLALEC